MQHGACSDCPRGRSPPGSTASPSACPPASSTSTSRAVPRCAAWARDAAVGHPPRPAGRRAARARSHGRRPGRPCPGSCRGWRPPPARGWSDTGLRLALLRRRRRRRPAWPGRRWPPAPAAMSAPVHVAHETGAWNLAVAAAFLAVAAAPAARGRGAAVPRHVRRAARSGHAGRPRPPGTCTLDRARRPPAAPGRGRSWSRRWPGAGAGAGRTPAAVRRHRACPREAGLGCSCSRCSLGWLARRRRSRPARRPRTPSLVSTDPGEGARLEQAPDAGHARVQRGRLPRRRLRPGARRPTASGSTRGRRRSTAASLTHPAAQRPPRRRLPGHLPGHLGRLAPHLGGVLLRGRRRRARAGRRGRRGPHRSGRRGRRSRSRGGRASPAWRWRSACRSWRCCAGRAAGRRPGCAGWPSGRGRGRRRLGPAASCSRAPTPPRRASGPRSIPSLLAATAASEAGRALLARAASPSRWPRVLRRSGAAAGRRRAAQRRRRGVSPPAWWSARPPSAIRSPGRWPGLAVAVDGRPRRGHGRLARAAWPGPAGRRAAARDPRRTTRPPSLPRCLAARLRRGGGPRGQRHRAGGARGRVADGAVRDHLRLGARGQAGAGRWSCWPRPASPGSGCSSGWASAGRGRRPRRSLTAHAFAAVGGRRHRRRGGRRPRRPCASRLQSESAAEHVPALRRSVLVEVAVAAVVLALSAVLVGTPPARVGDRPAGGRAAAAAGQRRPVRQRAGVGGPRPAGRQHAARLPVRRHRPAHPARRRSR